MSKIRFQIVPPIDRSDDAVLVAGSIPALGDWHPEKSLRLNWKPPFHIGEIEAPARFEYKILRDSWQAEAVDAYGDVPSNFSCEAWVDSTHAPHGGRLEGPLPRTPHAGTNPLEAAIRRRIALPRAIETPSRSLQTAASTVADAPSQFGDQSTYPNLSICCSEMQPGRLHAAGRVVAGRSWRPQLPTPAFGGLVGGGVGGRVGNEVGGVTCGSGAGGVGGA